VGDATQLRQVLMNLVINASDAIGPSEGTVRIRTWSAPGSAELFERAVVAPEEYAGRYVVLEVADTGAGMDEATLARIFDPFFTTKFTGRGLGLAAVLGIVRGHRGAISVASEPGRGTRFRVMIPAAEEPRAEQGGGGAAGAWRGSGTVLIADDEASVRAVTARALRAMGFDVIEAADGQEAVERFAEGRERIRLVLLDMTMPRMNGEAAFRAIRELEPGAKVVLMSGYTQQDAAEHFGEGLAGFLQKPYELGALQELVRRVLEEPAR
jgi:CheY-like chemotaxis protein